MGNHKRVNTMFNWNVSFTLTTNQVVVQSSRPGLKWKKIIRQFERGNSPNSPPLVHRSRNKNCRTLHSSLEACQDEKDRDVQKKNVTASDKWMDARRPREHCTTVRTFFEREVSSAPYLTTLLLQGGIGRSRRFAHRVGSHDRFTLEWTQEVRVSNYVHRMKQTSLVTTSSYQWWLVISGRTKNENAYNSRYWKSSNFLVEADEIRLDWTLQKSISVKMQGKESWHEGVRSVRKGDINLSRITVYSYHQLAGKKVESNKIAEITAKEMYWKSDLREEI